jgi:hypothetical protein
MPSQSRAPVSSTPEVTTASTDTATSTATGHERLPGTPAFDPADPLESFKAIVEAGDSEDVLNACAAVMNQSPATVNTIGNDHALMEKTAIKLGRERAPMGMLYLRQPLKWQVWWCIKAGGLTSQGWAMLVANADSQQCAEAIGWREVFDAISPLPGDPITLFPPLSSDPPMIKHCLDTYDYYGPWILRRGGPERMAQVLEAINLAGACAMFRGIMVAMGLWTGYIASMTGPSTDPAQSQRLWYYLLATTDVAEGVSLFKARFGVDLTVDNGATWDIESIKRTWLICDRTPGADVSATVRIIREGTTGEASGWAGDGLGQIGMTWGTNQIGATEVGAYTNDDDTMRGLNIFDAALRHEIGHNVGLSTGLDQAGGPVYAQFGWDKHASVAGFRTVLNAFLGAHDLPLDFIAAAQRDATRTGIINALANCHNTYNAARFETAVNAYGTTIGQAGLWAQISGSPFITYLLGRATIGAWNTQSDLGGRSYHVSYATEGFVSAPTARYSNLVSRYAMRSPEEWFAEVYATFYADADRPDGVLGALLEGRDAAAAEMMRTRVHGRHSLAQVTGQTNTTGIGAPPPPAPVGDFPAPNLPPGTAYA